jgi:hypothetical protein
MCSISGVGSVTLLQDSTPEIFPARMNFPLPVLGDIRLPDKTAAGISERVREMVREAAFNSDVDEIPADVASFAEACLKARNC